MDWLTTAEALALLGTQPQTLYANVSRGRIKARRDPSDSRKSLYRGDDIRRLAQRAAGRRKQEAVATGAMHWGDPVLATAISTVDGGRLLYRGQDACTLAETATLGEVATLLWRAPLRLSSSVRTSRPPGFAGAFAEMAERAARPSAVGRSPARLADEAGAVLATLAETLAGAEPCALHERLARLWRRPEAADVIRRALVVLADHELNASTFAARVTVSTGASLWAGALTGLATLSGPRHGRASRAIAALVDDVSQAGAPIEDALRDWLGEGRQIPGLGHPLYPNGDPRAAMLLASFDSPAAYQACLQAAETITGDGPNVDFALAALSARFALPADAAFTLFALARSVGWLAHMMEQIIGGEAIRPRARYVG